jgi:hypothetical protein
MKRTRVNRQSKKNPLVRECDALVRSIVFERDGYKCARCESRKVLDPAHVFAKGRYQNVRFLEINIVTGCRECHDFWHAHPRVFMAWFATMYPERHDELLRVKETYRRPDLKDLRLELLARQPEIASVPQPKYMTKDEWDSLPF